MRLNWYGGGPSTGLRYTARLCATSVLGTPFWGEQDGLSGPDFIASGSGGVARAASGGDSLETDREGLIMKCIAQCFIVLLMGATATIAANDDNLRGMFEKRYEAMKSAMAGPEPR